MKVLGNISESLYWEWRCAASELNNAKKDKLEQELKLEMMLKDLEIARLKAALFKAGIESYSGKVNIRQQDYDETKKKIESAIGTSLPEGCVINEQLEVIALEEPKEKKDNK